MEAYGRSYGHGAKSIAQQAETKDNLTATGFTLRVIWLLLRVVFVTLHATTQAKSVSVSDGCFRNSKPRGWERRECVQ
jgi:preprotein translocase subunit SecG